MNKLKNYIILYIEEIYLAFDNGTVVQHLGFDWYKYRGCDSRNLRRVVTNVDDFSFKC